MLTGRQKQILDMESQRWKYAGAKEAEIRSRFDVSPTVYYAELATILRDHPEAITYAPHAIRRLLRLQDARRRLRTQGSQD